MKTLRMALKQLLLNNKLLVEEVRKLRTSKKHIDIYKSDSWNKYIG